MIRMQTDALTKMRGCYLVDGAGHWVQQPEQPDKVSALLLDFLKQQAWRAEPCEGSSVVTKETDMRFSRLLTWATWSVVVLLTALPALAADYPAPKEGSWVVRDFRFHTGEVLPELRLHYTTVGAPTGEPVLILHGTTGSGAGMLTSTFAGELFGPGQPLDASRYYVILPDAIGTGKSSKPSDGLRASFPKYNYDDMVVAQYRLVTEHLGVRHLRLALGNSMGGMHTWIWAQKYPDSMDVAVPMASLPTEMSGRNWMMRRLIIDSIRNDPEWMNGNYTKQPRSLQFASVFYGIATNGGNQGALPGDPDSGEGRPSAQPAPERAVSR
jgi:homoserine O-acetyltransferase